MKDLRDQIRKDRPNLGQLLRERKAEMSSDNPPHAEERAARPQRRSLRHWSQQRHENGSRNYLVFFLEILFVSVVAYFVL